jgi:hypothetical protein
MMYAIHTEYGETLAPPHPSRKMGANVQTPPDELDADEIGQHLDEVPKQSRKFFAAFLAAYLRWMGGADGDEEMPDAELAFAEHDRLATVYRRVSHQDPVLPLRDGER